MATIQCTPAPRGAIGGNYSLDDDIEKVRRRSPAIRNDLIMVEDFCTNDWTTQEMVEYYNCSKTSLTKTGLTRATQLYDIVDHLKIRYDDNAGDSIGVLFAFWRDVSIDKICRSGKTTKDELLVMSFQLTYKYLKLLKAAGLEEHLTIETWCYSNNGYGMDIPDAYRRTMDHERRMKLLNKDQAFEMLGMNNTSE